MDDTRKSEEERRAWAFLRKHSGLRAPPEVLFSKEGLAALQFAMDELEQRAFKSIAFGLKDHIIAAVGEEPCHDLVKQGYINFTWVIRARTVLTILQGHADSGETLDKASIEGLTAHFMMEAIEHDDALCKLGSSISHLTGMDIQTHG